MRLSLHLLLRLLLLASLIGSAILLIDYTGSDPTFCSRGASCQAVKNSEYAQIFGEPLPVYGLGAFLGLYALAVWAETKRHLVSLAILTGLGAVGAIAFICIQLFVIEAICKWCMLVDGSAIAAAIVALILVRQGPVREPTPLRLGWSLVPAAVWLLTVTWARHPPGASSSEPLPEALRPLMVPGRLTIIEVTDFECPYCRALSEKMREIEERYPAEVATVLVMNPLAIHKGADIAARAYLCTPAEQRRGMSELLFKVRPDGLNPEGVAIIAQALGLDGAAFGACLNSSATDQELEYHATLVAAVGQEGVPVSYVGRELVLGNRPEQVEDALQHGLRAQGLVGPEAGPERDTAPVGLPLWLLFFIEGGIFLALGVLSFVVHARRPDTRYAVGTAP